MFTTSGVTLVPAAEQRDIVNYIFEPPEDLHLKAIVGTILISDLYRTSKIFLMLPSDINNILFLFFSTHGTIKLSGDIFVYLMHCKCLLPNLLLNGCYSGD